MSWEGLEIVMHDGLLLSMVLLAGLNSICASLCSLATASSLGDLIRKVG